MDRYAKSLRHKHRQAGHDTKTLVEMIYLFRHEYKPVDVIKTWILHKAIDNWDSKLKQTVRQENPGYGKKDNIMEIMEKLENEIYGK